MRKFGIRQIHEERGHENLVYEVCDVSMGFEADIVQRFGDKSRDHYGEQHCDEGPIEIGAGAGSFAVSKAIANHQKTARK